MSQSLSFFFHFPGKYFHPGKASFIRLPRVPQCADAQGNDSDGLPARSWGLNSGRSQHLLGNPQSPGELLILRLTSYPAIQALVGSQP